MTAILGWCLGPEPKSSCINLPRRFLISCQTNYTVSLKHKEKIVWPNNTKSCISCQQLRQPRKIVYHTLVQGNVGMAREIRYRKNLKTVALMVFWPFSVPSWLPFPPQIISKLHFLSAPSQFLKSHLLCVSDTNCYLERARQSLPPLTHLMNESVLLQVCDGGKVLITNAAMMRSLQMLSAHVDVEAPGGGELLVAQRTPILGGEIVGVQRQSGALSCWRLIL